MRRLDGSRHGRSGSISWRSTTPKACRDAPEERLDKVYQGKESTETGQAERSRNPHGTKCPYCLRFIDPEEVAPGACHFENGGPSSMAKKTVVSSRRRRALSEKDQGGLSTRTQGIAARQPSLHLYYKATLPSHSCTGQQENWTTSMPLVTIAEHSIPHCQKDLSSRRKYDRKVKKWLWQCKAIPKQHSMWAPVGPKLGKVGPQMGPGWA